MWLHKLCGTENKDDDWICSTCHYNPSNDEIIEE